MIKTGFGRTLRRFKLSPRIRLVVEQIPSTVSAAVGFWVKCGSRHEPHRLQGVTHLAEHLFFKGTSAHSAEEISQLIEMFGGELNAFTDREYTCFHAWVPRDRTQLALNLISEMLFDSLFDEAEFKKEKQVVIQELHGYEESPDDEFADGLLEIPWGNHPLGARIGGFSRVVKKFEHKDIIAYIRDVFLTSEIVISVASPLPPSEIKAQVKTALKRAESFCWGASLSTRAVRKQRVRKPQMAANLGDRSRLRRFKGDQVQTAFIFPAVRVEHKDEIIYSALTGLMGAGSSSYLFREVRENLGLAYNTYAQLMGYSDGGILLGYLATEKKKWLEAVKAAARVCGFLSKGISSADFDFIRGMMEGSIYMSFEGVNNRMETMGRQELMFGRIIDIRESLAEVQSMTLKSINRVAKMLNRTPCFYAMGPVSNKELAKLERAWREGLLDGKNS